MFFKHILGLFVLISGLISLSTLTFLHRLILDLFLSPTTELRIWLNLHYKTHSMLSCMSNDGDKTEALLCSGVVKAILLALVIATNLLAVFHVLGILLGILHALF